MLVTTLDPTTSDLRLKTEKNHNYTDTSQNLYDSLVPPYSLEGPWIEPLSPTETHASKRRASDVNYVEFARACFVYVCLMLLFLSSCTCCALLRGSAASRWARERAGRLVGWYLFVLFVFSTSFVGARPLVGSAPLQAARVRSRAMEHASRC